MARGSLRIYLGASPGVGKTYAMLGEGCRRAERGADVVIGVIETHGRRQTAEQIRDLELVPRREIEYRGARLEEMDVDAIVARRPEIVLVDEFAHTNAPGSRNEKRWQDVEALLEAGIDVISTLNIQHLESLNDVITRITGTVQRETVPDAIVRRADQLELVDMSPEAIRRRMAHGNIYPADRVDAALSNYFRPGNLGALRELALLWVAGRVEESLSAYLADHGITDSWETRERVVVGITGTANGDALIRRAARMAGRVGGDLIGVHVASGDGLATEDGSALTAQRRLVTELGGTVHEVVGHAQAETLVAFARTEKATQLVLGASRRSRRYEWWHGSFVANVTRLANGMDVHVIAQEGVPAQDFVSANAAPPIERRRTLVAWAMTAVGVPLLTIGTVAFRDHLELSTELLLFMALIVATAAIGGRLVAAVAAVASSLCVNWFFVEPRNTLTISEPENIIALMVFVAVAFTVGSLVDIASRRALEARLARAEAEALARSSASLAAEPDPLPGLVEQLVNTFSLGGVRIEHREADGWSTIAASGEVGLPATSATVALPLGQGEPADATHRLLVFGRALTADEQRLLRVLADQLAIAIDTQQLAKDASDARALAEIDTVRTALLRAVSHDLRTPLASIKAMVSGLRDDTVAWTPAQIAEALATVDEETDRLNRLVGNLLDASRLQIGALAVQPRDVEVAEAVMGSLNSLGVPSGQVRVEIPDDLALVDADPALLERSLANIIANAIRHSPEPGSVRIVADAIGSMVHLSIVDRGPGIDLAHRQAVMAPFQRLGDQSSGDGVGLGLAIAQGFVEAMGGSLGLDETPGGGLTATIALRMGRRSVHPSAGTADPIAAASPPRSPSPSPVASA